MLSIKQNQLNLPINSDLHTFGLTYGISLKMLTKVGFSCGLNLYHSKLLSKRKINLKIQKSLKTTPHSVALRLRVKRVLTFLWTIRCYKGFRHKFCLPARGQRTKTNARTKKAFKFF